MLLIIKIINLCFDDKKPVAKYAIYKRKIKINFKKYYFNGL